MRRETIEEIAGNQRNIIGNRAHLHTDDVQLVLEIILSDEFARLLAKLLQSLPQILEMRLGPRCFQVRIDERHSFEV